MAGSPDEQDAGGRHQGAVGEARDDEIARREAEAKSAEDDRQIEGRDMGDGGER